MKDIVNTDGITASDAKSKMSVPVINSRKKEVKIVNTASLSSLSSEIKVKELYIDLSYQRVPNERKVMNIVNNFNPDALGALICSARDDGTIAVIDGGHRLAALRFLNKEDMNVNCLVYFGLSLEDEANIFTQMNDNRTKPKTSDIFKSKVVSGDRDAIDVNNILKSFNLGITNGPANNAVRAVGTLNAIYKKNGRLITIKTIDTLIKAFDSHSSSLSDTAMLAVAQIYSVFNNKNSSIDQDRLIKVISSFGNSMLWRNKGQIITQSLGYKDVHTAMAVCAVNEYNKKLRTNRLDATKLI